jgi:hypothetical protein
MDKKKYIFYVAIAFTLLACGVFGGGNDTNSADNGSAGSESGGESGSGGETGSGDEGSSGQPSLGGLLPGPESLDLSLTALYAFAPNYTSQVGVVFEGAAEDGSPLSQTIEISQKFQTQPTESSSAVISTTLSELGEGYVMETATIEGQTYTYAADMGCFVFPMDSSDESFDDLFTVDGLFTNQASRAETGVEINGFITDRYEITEANINPDHEDFDTEFSLTEGDLYVARDGGFITRMILEGFTYVTDFEGFDPTAETPATFTFNYIPVEGELDISPPAGCADQVSEDSDYPIMDDPAQLASLPGMVFYETSHTLDEVLEFYKTEMVAEGWTLTDESTLGSFASLTFTKDGKTVNVLPVQNGDIVAVTIVEE